MKKVSTAKRLNHAMSLRDIKQTELVEKSGISKSTISGYVNGAFETIQDLQVRK